MVLILFHLCDPAVPFWDENSPGPVQDWGVARTVPKNGEGARLPNRVFRDKPYPNYDLTFRRRVRARYQAVSNRFNYGNVSLPSSHH
jgi:hypothetical protein